MLFKDTLICSAREAKDQAYNPEVNGLVLPAVPQLSITKELLNKGAVKQVFLTTYFYKNMIIGSCKVTLSFYLGFKSFISFNFDTSLSNVQLV